MMVGQAMHVDSGKAGPVAKFLPLVGAAPNLQVRFVSFLISASMVDVAIWEKIDMSLQVSKHVYVLLLESTAVFWFSSHTASSPIYFLSHIFPCSFLTFQGPALNHTYLFCRPGSVGDLAMLMYSSQLGSLANPLFIVVNPWKELCWKFLESFGRAVFSLLDVIQVEGAVSVLFGIGQRWKTTPPPPILRFNSGDPQRLSSVMHPQYLQLNLSIPLVQTPESLPEEPPGERQLVCSTLEALEDWRCSIFESELSSDKRWLIGSVFDLQRLVLEYQYVSSIVLLGTSLSSYELCKRDFMSLSCTCYYA